MVFLRPLVNVSMHAGGARPKPSGARRETRRGERRLPFTSWLGRSARSFRIRSLVLVLPALALAQPKALDLPPPQSRCMREVQITPEDEMRYLGQRATHEVLLRLAKGAKCEEIHRSEVVQLRQQYVPFGKSGAQAIAQLAAAGFECRLDVRAAQDFDRVTRTLVPAEQAVYECSKPLQDLMICERFVVRLLPPGQAPGTTREQHQAVIDRMAVDEDVLYYGCRDAVRPGRSP